MDKIEKIRQEIERLKETHERNLDKPMERGRIGHAHGYVDCCDELLSFFDTLSEDRDKSLEEAAEKYCEKVNHRQTTIITDSFKAGAQWQKVQMMKEAEECDLYYDGDFLAIDLNMAALGYSERDKVRVIIIPNTDEK